MTMECCEAVVASVDTKGCLCDVMNSSFMVWSSSLSVGSVLDIYQKCGGLRPLNGQNDCQEVKVDAPGSKDNQDPLARAADPDPATPSNREDAVEATARRDFVLDVLELSISLLVLLFVLGRHLVNLFKKIKTENMSVQQQAMDTAVQNGISKFFSSIRDEMRSSAQEQIREGMRGMLPGRPVRAVNLIEMTERDVDLEEEDDEENMPIDGATILTHKKKMKTLKGQGSTSEIQEP